MAGGRAAWVALGWGSAGGAAAGLRLVWLEQLLLLDRRGHKSEGGGFPLRGYSQKRVPFRLVSPLGWSHPDLRGWGAVCFAFGRGCACGRRVVAREVGVSAWGLISAVLIRIPRIRAGMAAPVPHRTLPLVLASGQLVLPLRHLPASFMRLALTIMLLICGGKVARLKRPTADM